MSVRTSERSIDEDTLLALQVKGVNHPLVNARLVYSEASQLLGHFVGKTINRERVYPEILPTQASGRWSTTNPPLTNYPRHDPEDCSQCDSSTPWCPRDLRGLFIPDTGYYWLCWDWDAIEARIAAILTKDEEDLNGFAQGWDVHTLTACRMFGLPMPPVLTKAHHRDERCLEWRTLVDWGGSEDRRRQLAKTFRYALQYAPRTRPEYAALNAKGIGKLGLGKDDVLKFGRLYLRAKLHSQAVKHHLMDQIIATGEARTAFGRVRRFIRVKAKWQLEEYAKQGWSHMISGTVSGVMNRTLIALLGEGEQWGILTPYGATLAMNVHDAAKISLPVSVPYKPTLTFPSSPVIDQIKALVGREWDLWGTKIRLPAQFHVVHANGEHEDLNGA